MKKCTLLLLLAISAGASAQQFPKMHAGLWQTTTMTRGGDGASASAPRVSTICLDDSVQKLMVQFAQGIASGLCSKHDLHINGSSVDSDAVCELMGSRTTTHSTMKFTGDTSYHGGAHTTYDPPFNGRKEADTVIDGRYMGPCPAGMVPGDLSLPGGKTINLRMFTGGK